MKLQHQHHRVSLTVALFRLIVAAVLLSKSAVAEDPSGVLADPERTEMTQAGLLFPGAALLNSRPPFLAGVTVNQADGEYVEGATLQISFMAEEQSFLYLLYHQADGSSLLLYPNIAAPNNRVAAGRQISVPPQGLPPEKQYRFRIQAPFGQEVLQVLAVREPVLELNALATMSRKAAPVDRTLIAAMAERLRSDLTMWTEHRVRIHTVSKDGRPNQTEPNRPDRPDEPDRSRQPVDDSGRITGNHDSARRRIGLFIGIGEYREPKLVTNHKELADSARVMHDVMLKHGQLDVDRTKLVLNEKATRASIQRLFLDWLPSVSSPGDVIFIYFSGHAGQFPTDDPREPDGQDEAIAPYDLSAGDERLPVEQRRKLLRDSNILDDTLARWLEELTGRQIVLIFDTCHSGGFIEDKGPASSSMFVDEAARVKDIAQMGTLILTSCAADEQSLFEGTPNGTMWFTYCLTEAIAKRETDKPLTVQAAFGYAQKQMKQLLVEGNADRQQKPTMTDRILLPVVLTQ